MSIPATVRIGGASDLKLLHALQQPQQLTPIRALIQSATLQCGQQLVRCLERGETTCLRLLLDDKATRNSCVKHHSRQALQAWTEAKHFAGTDPRSVEQHKEQ